MSYHIYAFGSICRGDVTFHSDIDLLAIVDGLEKRFDPNRYSIYSKRRLEALWFEGNPFAWNLAKGSRLLFSPDGSDVLEEFGDPAVYSAASSDCQKFHMLFCDGLSSFSRSSYSRIFDLSSMFLAIRNFATCYMLGVKGNCNFTRDSAMQMDEESIPLARATYDILVRARLIATRGVGDHVSADETCDLLKQLKLVDEWMRRLRNDAFETIRIQQSNGCATETTAVS